MITEITVEQIAVIERARLELGPGLTVLTGETGAGKSLLIDGIELALGCRADTDQIRTGSSRGRVTMRVEGKIAEDLFGSSPSLIEREIYREGRSTCRLNSKPILVGDLRQIGSRLVDLHGQHQHHALLDPVNHGEYLDAWIGPSAIEAKTRVSAAFATWQTAQQRLQSLRRDQRDRESRIDLLRFQVNEIESVASLIGEFEELEQTASRLAHSEKLLATIEQVMGRVFEDEHAAADRVGDAAKSLLASIDLDRELIGVAEPLQEARFQLEEALHRLSLYRDRLEYEPAEAERIAERLESLRNLRRKYGPEDQDVIAHLEHSKAELEDLTNESVTEESLALEVDKASKAYFEASQVLSSIRRSGAGPFAKAVGSELRELAMEKAEFEVRLTEKAPDANGVELIEFLFSANPGEDVKPLAKIASGGEMSRVMLTLKVCLAGKAGVPCLIFDEVDAGLSGKAAATVARKLVQLASHVQVIAISHLPQVAAVADTHYRIEKRVEAGRTKTDLRQLDREGRLHEVARMLSGDAVTEAALANARELISLKVEASLSG